MMSDVSWLHRVKSRVVRYVMMEAEGPPEGADVKAWIAAQNARSDDHYRRAAFWFKWTAGIAAVAVVSVAIFLLRSDSSPPQIVAPALGVVLLVPAVMAGWHAGKTTRIANAISAAMGQKTRFWTEYRIGAAALALAILAKHSPWAS